MARRLGGLFDWNIVSPAATIEVLQLMISGELPEIFRERRNYVIESGKLKCAALRGFYFWHEDGQRIVNEAAAFDQFQSKILHLINNMIALRFLEASKTIVWSNIQPNLRSAVSSLEVGWPAFCLTRAVYDEISLLVDRLFGSGARCVFITRSADCSFEPPYPENVFVLELHRSSDYKGPLNLYDPVLP